MIYLFLDFETSSELNIKVVGAMKYVHHPSTEVVLASYQFNSNPVKVTALFYALADSFDKTGDTVTVIAHNAFFEYQVVKRFYPELFERVVDWIDTKELCARAGLPLNLNEACFTLGIGSKINTGKNIIEKLNGPKRIFYKDLSSEEQDLFKEYAKVDVELTIKLFEKLRYLLEPKEHANALFTLNVNARGIKIDEELLSASMQLIEKYEAWRLEEVKRLVPCDSGINTPNQTAKIAKFLGVESTRKEFLLEHLKTETDPIKRQLIELRVNANQKAYTKFKKLSLRQHNGRLYDSLLYHGAHTGRFSSIDVQVQNLKRSDKTEANSLIERIKKLDIPTSEIPIALGQSVRGVFIPEEGQKLICIDYAQVEARILAWLCNEESLIKKFEMNYPIYEEMASRIFKIPMDKVTKSQRNIGKTTILGCGYGMGGTQLLRTISRFIEPGTIDTKHLPYDRLLFVVSRFENCKPEELKLDFENNTLHYKDKLISNTLKELGFSFQCVTAFRNSRPAVKNLWDALEFGAVEAFKTEEPIKIGKLKFFTAKGHLFMNLPSGRNILYRDVELKKGKLTAIFKDKGHFVRLNFWGGDITNHACQGLCRDLLCEAMKFVGKNSRANHTPNLMFTVHDELVYSYDNEKELLELVKASKPAWAEGLPLDFSCSVGDRYFKD